VNRVLANFGPAAVELLPVSRRLSIPLIAHFHGFDAHQRQVTERHADGYRDVGRHAAAVIAVSDSMIDALCAMGVPQEKIHLARCGVDPVAFPAREGLPTGPPLFFGVGRFVDKKAPYLTLMAFAEARKRLPGATLVLGGTGELLEATRNLSRALNLEKSVSFPGVLTPAEVAGWMRKATAFVQHSLEPLAGPALGDREGTPVTILEAMMTGVPVISTRHGGIQEVISSGENGLLVDERDVAGMAEAMVAIGLDSALAGRLGAAARSCALLRYTADGYISSLHKVLESAA
jgi:glycosyltransferase involved in cell wall biosynthesis